MIYNLVYDIILQVTL